MLSVYLYQSFPSGMSSDISLSVRTCLNILHKNSTFFSLSLYCLIFVFSTNTCQNKNCTGQKSCWFEEEVLWNPQMLLPSRGAQGGGHGYDSLEQDLSCLTCCCQSPSTPSRYRKPRGQIKDAPPGPHVELGLWMELASASLNFPWLYVTITPFTE